MDAGNHSLTVTAVPDENHNGVSRTVRITVNKADSLLAVNDVNMDYGSFIMVPVSFTGATGVTAKICDENLEVSGSEIIIPVMDVGKYSMTVTTIPDKNHNSVSKTAAVNINKANSKVTASDLTAAVGHKLTLNVMVTSFEIINEGAVVFLYGGVKIGQANVKGGFATIEYIPLKEGIYPILAVYNGSSIYKA